MESKGINNEGQDDELSLKEVFFNLREWCRYLLSKWKIILLGGLIGGAFGFIYAYFTKPVYTAECTFVLEEEGKGGLSQYAGLASMVGIDFGSGGTNGIFQGDNIIELYKSRLMVQKTLLTSVNLNGKEQLLIDRYIEFNKLREKWLDKPQLKSISFGARRGVDFNRMQDSLLGNIVNDINKNYMLVSKPDKKLSIIKVTVKAKDEFFAKAFNDQIVKNVNDFYVQTKTKKSLENLSILQHQTDSVRASLNNAISGVASSIDDNPNSNPALRILQVPSQRKQVDAEANKAILTELVKNLEIGKVSLRKETPLIQVIDQPIFPLESTSFGKIKGLLIGGLITGLLATVFLLLKRFFQNLINS